MAADTLMRERSRVASAASRRCALNVCSNVPVGRAPTSKLHLKVPPSCPAAAGRSYACALARVSSAEFNTPRFLPLI